jgi:hypothetical protein
MEYDVLALTQKRDEVLNLAREAREETVAFDTDAAAAVLGAFVELTPPEKPEYVFHLITMNSFAQDAESRKPGNLFLNWRKLIDIVPDTTIAAAGATAAPAWLLPFIALYVWNKLWCGAKETLTKDEATIIMALWKHRSGKSTIGEDEGFTRTNEVRLRQGLRTLRRNIYDQAIDRLLRMHCIEMNEGVIWLREWVRITY